MAERGYPTEGYERQASMLSVDHARTLDHYREAHAITERQDRGEAPTEDQEFATADQEPVELYPASTTAGDSPLFSTDDTENSQVEWRALRSEFVDDPREAVQRADELVARVVQSLTDTSTEHQRVLEEQRRQGEQVQTEELWQALKRYRTFFDRLLFV